MANRASESRSPVIEYEEWANELQSLQRKNDPGKTAREIAEVWGVSQRIAYERLGKLNRMGRIRMGHRMEARIDGKLFPMPVYTVSVAPKKVKR